MLSFAFFVQNVHANLHFAYYAKYNMCKVLSLAYGDVICCIFMQMFMQTYILHIMQNITRAKCYF